MSMPRSAHHYPILWTLLGILAVLPACDSVVTKSFEVPDPDGLDLLPRDLGSGNDTDLQEGAPVILRSVQPDHGPFTGGTKVRLSGAGFVSGMEVSVGGLAVAAEDIELIGPQSLSIITPAGEVGPADVQVRRRRDGDGGLLSQAQLAGGFTYDPIDIRPSSGPVSGGTLITLTAQGLDLRQVQQLLLGGQAFDDLRVISATVIRARTPAHSQGPVALSFKARLGGQDILIDDAFSYYQSTKPLAGGLSGGPVEGTLTVSVLNWISRKPVANAKVIVQRSREVSEAQLTNAQGSTIFIADGLKGPLTITAGADSYETSTLVQTNARDVTILLYPIIPPNPGGLPPGQQIPRIEGHVLFGGSTGAGLRNWGMVPEPKAGELRRLYVFSTSSSLAHGAPRPTPEATIDFNAGDNATAWPFALYVRPGNLAVYGVAGLYNTRDDSFRAYALGIRRGIVVGPGDRRREDIVMNIPLSETFSLELKNTPKGVDRHQVTLGIALGADGYLVFDAHDLNGPFVPKKLLFTRLPSFSHPPLVDATYSLDVFLDSSAPDGLPLSQAREPLIPGSQKQLVIEDFLAVPTQLRPAAKGRLEGNTLRFGYAADAPPYDLAVTSIESADQTPIWRIVSPRGVTEIKLPDPETFGLTSWPKGPLVWLQWLAKLDRYDYSHYNYQHLRSSQWRRYSFDQFTIRVDP